MNKLKFSQSHKSVSIDDFNSIEREIGIIIPDELKALYLENNGGKPNLNGFYVSGTGSFIEINKFIPMKYNNVCNIKEIYKILNNKRVIDRDYIPFAIDYGGNYICINAITNNVYMIYMDLGEFSEKNMRFLSENLNSFLDNLEEYEEEDL